MGKTTENVTVEASIDLLKSSKTRGMRGCAQKSSLIDTKNENQAA